MLKILDIDEIFDSFLTDYIKKNTGKFSEKEWEERIPLLYDEFGKTPLDELDGATPEDYYASADGEELCALLAEHIKRDVCVSDFLCKALINCDCEKQLAELVDENNDEELVSYCVNVLIEKGSSIAFDKYFDMILSDSTCEDMKDLLAEALSYDPETAKDRALAEFDGAGSSAVYLLEILAACKNDDRVLAILLRELRAHKNDIPLYLSYVTKYGDDKALPCLMELIDDASIDYLAFKELKLAIEGFGGSYDKPRDFSSDKYFKKLKGND